MPKLLIKPSDAKSWSLCKRRVWFDNHPPENFQIEIDAFDQLVIDLGLAHEQAVLAELAQAYPVVSAQSVQHTRELMAEGVAVIYQAELLDEGAGLTGKPDFLIKHKSGFYQAADAKLALDENKKDIQVQLGFYRRLLNNALPAIVFHGDGSSSEIDEEADKFVDQFITDMRELLAAETMPEVHYSHSKCRACPYYTICKPLFEAEEQLSLLYGIQGRAADALQQAGIQTISQLAAADPAAMPDVPYLKGFDNKQRAVLQARAYITGEVYLLSDPALPSGTWVHFDIEDNPLTASGTKHVYLWGFLLPGYGNDDFEYVWIDSEAEDQVGWLLFLEKIEDYRQRFPGLILAHYSNHEVTTIRQYAKRYAMQDDDRVLWLLGADSPLFDIQKPVTDNLVLPLQGYGLKDICKHKDLVNFQWEDADSGSQWSVVQFNRYLLEQDPQQKARLKAEILGYNRDDVIATRKLEEWLRQRFMH